jgi:hypothetical protein
MWHQKNKLDRANVVAGFESNDDVEEAIMGLRNLGYKDVQIGYYSANGQGEMDDQLARYHRFAGSVVGSVIGAIVGWACARWALILGQDLDQFGLAMSAAVTGAFFFGMLGGFMGLWIKQPKDEASVPNGFAEPYVITVDAGDRWEQAWSTIRQHGGHELETASTEFIPHNRASPIGAAV